MEAMTQLLPLPFSSYLPNDPRDAELLRLDMYWRAAVRESLRPEHVKPRSMGPWGTCPGLRCPLSSNDRFSVEATLYTREHGEDPPENRGMGMDSRRLAQ
jgi:hypothetical protein